MIKEYILANPAGWGRCFSTISCLSWLACSTDMLNMICAIRKVLPYWILLQPMPVLVGEWTTSQQCEWSVWLNMKISNEEGRHVRNVKWEQSSGKRCNWLVGRSACVADSQMTRWCDPWTGLRERLFSFQTRRPFSSCVLAFKLFFFWCISKDEIYNILDFTFYFGHHSGTFTCFTRNVFSFS